MLTYRCVMAFALAGLISVPSWAAPPNQNERYYLGDYVVRTEADKPTKCRVSIGWANDVGGEFAARGCEVWPDLSDAARWQLDADTGDLRFLDPLHKQRFRVTETDAGFVAILSDDTHLWFEAAPRRSRH